MLMEDLGRLFKGDPMFPYMINNLTNGQLMFIVDKRRKRMEKHSDLLDALDV